MLRSKCFFHNVLFLMVGFAFIHPLKCETIHAETVTNPDENSSKFLESVEHGYAKNGETKIHYAAIGKGPLVVMIHGFPDYWYTWRKQMMALKSDFRVVAMDLRGYNLSDQPKGVENYLMTHLVQDVEAVIKSQGREKAIIVGHDWGGAIAWQVAITKPKLVDRLIVCNMTHPTGQSRASLAALKANGNVSYMDTFRKQNSDTLPVAWLNGWVKDPAEKKHYAKAFERSSVECMINYYKANTKTKEQREQWLKDPKIAKIPPVNIPVLAIFGTRDKYVSKKGLNDTWDWVSKDFTLVAIPNAAHFVQQDAPELVSRSMKGWLLRDKMVTQEDQLSAVSGLIGKWQRITKRGLSIEQWTKSGPSSLRGIGYIESEDAERLVTEEILITKFGDDIYYIPKTKGNAMPVPFKLVSNTENQLVFENPDHDFPQRIEYQLPKSSKSITATISDMQRTKSIKFDFEKSK